MVFVADSAKQGGVSKARPVSVQLGAAWEGYLQVKGDLKPGESVVVQGNERLRPGQDVVVVREQAGPELKTAARANAE
jgi:multidrug efflux pump subunit AcrA (membrane-fusion protein)